MTSASTPVTIPGGAGSQRVRPVHPRDGMPSLQRRYGNRGARAVVQAKLNVGAVDDPLEREADRISRLAMGGPVPGSRAEAEEGPESVQRAPETIRRVHGAAGGAADPAVESAVKRARGGGMPVPSRVRERMERVSGADLSGVRVHANAESDRLNEMLSSRACTVGADVFVRRGEYRPGSARGDALLGHELTHTVQQGAGKPRSSALESVPSAPTVQRKFGFELELAVPVFSRVDEVEGPPIPLDTEKGIELAKEDSFDVHFDHLTRLNSAVPKNILHLKSAPIVELVTHPFDEFADSESHVENVMRDLERIADVIKAGALDKGASIPLDGIAGLIDDPDRNNFVGCPEGETTNPSQFSVNAYVQETHGVSLKRVAGKGNEFDARVNQPGSRVAEEYKKSLLSANDVADGMVEFIRKKKRKGAAWDEEMLTELRGFFAVIAYYLEVGKEPFPYKLAKNQTGLFYYKTALSTIRNDLLLSYPAALGELFGGKRARKGLIAELLKLTGRKSKEPVFMHEEWPPSCGEWVESVLAGTADQIFSITKNSYSGELHDNYLGRGSARGRGVVVENRRFAESEGRTKERRNYAPSEWPRLAVNLRSYLRALQGDIFPGG